MRRRDFIALAGAAAAFPRAAFAQQAAKLPRVAFLDVPRSKAQTDGFFQGLADRGYIDGKNVVIEMFIAPTTADLPAVAAKAVASAPAVIFADGNQAADAAAQATKTIPIVFRTSSDPVGLGLVSNLAHPDGNVTGAAALGSVTAAKELGFLTEMVPGLSRVASFGRSADGPADAVQRADVLAAGKATGVDFIVIDVTNLDDFRPYFAQAVAARAQAVYFGGGYAYQGAPVSWDVMNALTAGQKQQPTYNAASLSGNNNMPSVSSVLNYLALLNGLPAVWGLTGAPGLTSGALLQYGESIPGGSRRAAYFVDDIIRGAKPQDLPVELPPEYDFQINLKTAKALGLVVPADVLLVATDIIE